MNDSDDKVLFSRSLLSRRQSPSHAKVRSTVHRIGKRTQPSLPSGRRTIESCHRALSSTHCERAKLWYLLSAYIRTTLPIGWPVSLANNSGAALASSTLAAVT